MFDRAEIVVKAGDGGHGAVSFRREKFMPFGGPDGGDGGHGGNAIVLSDEDVSSLVRFRYMGLHRAGDGGKGQGKKQHGKNGRDLILRVPPGTVVWEKQGEGSQTVVADLAGPGQQVVIARGGRGGWGNVHFVSSTEQTPRIARKGEAGEEKRIILELRLIADVGIIGCPNAGKSSLLAAASAAKPKIAGYAFTTLAPILGVVNTGLDSFVMAEIPGLIEGAHEGRGLGFDFLRHAMRTKIFIHVIDGTSTHPLEDMKQVNNELRLFEPALAQRPQLVAVNKVDLSEVQAKKPAIRQEFRRTGVSPIFISATTGEGVAELMVQAKKLLAQEEARVKAAESVPEKVFHPRPRATPPAVSKEDGAFAVVSPELERSIAGFATLDAAVLRYLKGQLDRLGVTRALVKAGIRPGDKVRCGKFEWEW